VTPIPWDQVTSAIWTSSGEVIAVRSTGQFFRLDPRTGRTQTLSIKQPHRIWWPAISRDGRTLASADPDTRTVQIWSAETFELTNDLPISLDKDLPISDSDGVRILEFTPDGKTLASAGADRKVKLWDVATGQELLTLEGPSGPIWILRFSPDGRVLAAVSSHGVANSPREVFLWRTAADEPVPPAVVQGGTIGSSN
jgi:WD40 repeat protein